jgi:hypothetical protein
MLTNWLLIVWALLWLPVGAGLYLWLRWRQIDRRGARRPGHAENLTEAPVEVLSTEEELRRRLRQQSRQ